MSRIPAEKRHLVITLYLKGLTLKEIEARTGVDYSTVRWTIDRFKQGHYEEYGDLYGYADEVREYSKLLRATGQTVGGAAAGLLLLKVLGEVGIEPQEFRAAIELFKRISPPSFPIKSFVDSALHIRAVETESGLTFDQLQDNWVQSFSDVMRFTVRKRQLSEEVGAKQAEKEQAERDLKQTLADNLTTKDEVKEYVGFREEFQKAGTGPSELKPLADLLKEVTAVDVLKQAVELAKREKMTGRDINGIVQEYDQKLEVNRKLDTDNTELSSEKSKLQEELGELRQAINMELAGNNATREQLREYCATRERLARKGVEIKIVGVIDNLAAELKKHNLDVKNLVALLQREAGLEQAITRLEEQHSKLQTDIDDSRTTFGQLGDQILESRSELEDLRNNKGQYEMDLENIRQTIQRAELAIGLSYSLVKLLNAAPLAKQQVQTLISTLQRSLELMESNESAPIDRELLKGLAMNCFERVTGKKLMTAERMEAEAELSAQRRTELELHRLNELDKAELESRSEQDIVALAVKRQGGPGEVKVRACRNCGWTQAWLGSAPVRFDSGYCPKCFESIRTRSWPGIRRRPRSRFVKPGISLATIAFGRSSVPIISSKPLIGPVLSAAGTPIYPALDQTDDKTAQFDC